MEPGQDAGAFEADLAAARAAAAAAGHDVTSLVFPRNQVNPDYLPLLRRNGFTVYRGNPDAWPYVALPAAGQTPVRRAVRLLDAHVPLVSTVPSSVDGHSGEGEELPVDVPATRYIRPWRPRTARFADLRVRRIGHEMREAARKGSIVHLWWHPHDFGADIDENLRMLERILQRFASLRDEGLMVSRNMREVGESVGAV
jgi:hypothetical protein